MVHHNHSPQNVKGLSELVTTGDTRIVTVGREKTGRIQMSTFSAGEILETHRRYIDTRNRIEAGDLGWAALAEFFTEDATFVDPDWGRFDGRDNLIEFFSKSMAGLEDWSFPHEWEAIDGNYIITGWQNRLPGKRADGTFYQAPGMSRMLYAGNGKFCYEQDLLNMVHVMELVPGSADYLSLSYRTRMYLAYGSLEWVAGEAELG